MIITLYPENYYYPVPYGISISGVNLRPGVNVVTAEDMAAVESHPDCQDFVTRKFLEIDHDSDGTESQNSAAEETTQKAGNLQEAGSDAQEVEPPFVGDEIPDLNPLNALEAIAIVHKQTDPEILTLLAEGERANDNRKTVLEAIEKQIEKLQAK